MNIELAATAVAQNVADRITASRQPLNVTIVRAIVRQAFAAGVLYGLGRAQHAVAITRAAVLSERPDDEGALHGCDRCQAGIVETHAAAQRQAAALV